MRFNPHNKHNNRNKNSTGEALVVIQCRLDPALSIYTFKQNMLALRFLSIALLAIYNPLTYAADSYNPTDNTLTIPTVTIQSNGEIYKNVIINIGSFKIISVGTAAATAKTDTFSLSTLRLSIPSVSVNGVSYGNVLIQLGQDFQIISVGSKSATTETIPITVGHSSYENKMAAAKVLGAQFLPTETQSGNAFAYADFFQNGSYSLVTHSLEYNNQDINTITNIGHIHFYQKINGNWVDYTNTLLTDNSGCLHPRKAVVADFNSDERPDVFFACHGFDSAPFPGEQPVLLLSQPDGTYQKSKLPFTGFFHAASAADINGDGYADLLITDTMTAKTPFFFINNQDTSFQQDLSRLPSSLKYKEIFTAELVDFWGTGHYDAFIAGHEQRSNQNGMAPATLYRNDGTGKYISTTPLALPKLAGFGLTLDAVFTNNTIYLLRTIDADSNFYGGFAIQKISYPSLTSQSLLEIISNYWTKWIIPYEPNIVSMDSADNVSVPQ